MTTMHEVAVRIAETQQGPLFWRLATIAILGACVVLIVSAALRLALALLRGGRDDDDDRAVAPHDDVSLARARLDAATRSESAVARVHGVSDRVSGVDAVNPAVNRFPRPTAKGFKRRT